MVVSRLLLLFAMSRFILGRADQELVDGDAARDHRAHKDSVADDAYQNDLPGDTFLAVFCSVPVVKCPLPPLKYKRT
jgi:hypothetical protein